jgi:hypothetical protein
LEVQGPPVLAAGRDHGRRVLGRPGHHTGPAHPDPRRDHSPHRSGPGHRPDERLTVRDALALYTAGSAYATHRETETGSLGPGKLADFTVLDRNPLSVDPEQITGIQVLASVVDGTPTHQKGSITFPES